MLSDQVGLPVQLVAGAVASYVVFVVGRFVASKQPGDQIMTVPPNMLSLLLAPIWPPRGWIGCRWSHWIPFDRARTNIIPLIWPVSGKRSIYVADAAAVNIIFNDRRMFVKPVHSYKLISFLGPNIVGVEGETWVRHRAITRKSFGERNNALLWKETVSTLRQWFDEWDAEITSSRTHQTIVEVRPALRDITLLVIASAGFGMQFKRASQDKPAAEYKMTFGEALFTAIDKLIVKVLAPNWMYSLPIPALRQTDTAYTELKRYIGEMIAEARCGKTSDGRVSVGRAELDEKETGSAADLFRRLVAANEADGATRLSEDELMSNIFAFFLAGHETSSHTITFALALLAIHPEIQDRVYEEARKVWPGASDPADAWNSSSQADFNRLEYTLAVFRETLRLFPAVVRTRRDAVFDTTLPSRARDPDTGEWVSGPPVKVSAGTPCILNIHAVHMSPLYWGADAEEFRPDRFIDTADYQWPREAWIPFTAGPRVCLGQRFSALESVCIIARILRKYRLSPTPEVAKLTRREQWVKLTKWSPGVTATPGKVKLVLQIRD